VTWLRVTVTSPSDELTARLAEGLIASGASAIEERDGRVSTYLPLDGRAVTDVARQVRGTLAALLGADPPRLDFEQVPAQDWLLLWRAGLEPRRMGRIIVAPTWSEVDAGTGDIVIRIDPQMAFGTGEHASTRGVLRLMQRAIRAGDSVLDIGTGSAILAIAAALLGARSVRAVDSDPDTIENASENIARNGVAGCVLLQCSLVDSAFLAECGGRAFDGIVANVLSSVLRPLLPAMHAALQPGGWAILSGILLDEAEPMRAAAHDAGFDIEAGDTEEQWWSVLLRARRSAAALPALPHCGCGIEIGHSGAQRLGYARIAAGGAQHFPH
jgi:ribosomal protein L11 methyltransferase